jgi:hypothetical protein
MASNTKLNLDDLIDPIRQANSDYSRQSSQSDYIENPIKSTHKYQNPISQRLYVEHTEKSEKEEMYYNNSPPKTLKYKIIPHFTFPDPQQFKYNMRFSEKNRIQPKNVEEVVDIYPEDDIDNSKQIENNTNKIILTIPESKPASKSEISKIETHSSRKDSYVQKVKCYIYILMIR